MKTCADFDKEPDKPDCCATCHGVIEDGYNDGGHAVCCKVAGWLKSKGIDIYEE